MTLCGRHLINCAQHQLFLNKRLFHLSSFNNCHYKVLRVSRGASQAEIKTAFLNLSKELHPDVNPRMKTHEKFVKVNEAYSVLSKPSERRQYDQTLHRQGAAAAHTYAATPTTSASQHQQHGAHTSYEEMERMRAEQEYWSQYYVKPDPNHKKPYKNSHIVISIILFAIIANAIQFLVIGYSFNSLKERELKQTRKVNSLLRDNRKRREKAADGKEYHREMLVLALEEMRNRRVSPRNAKAHNARIETLEEHLKHIEVMIANQKKLGKDRKEATI